MPIHVPPLNVPPWLIGGLVTIAVGLLLYHLVLERQVMAGRHEKALARAMGTGEEVVFADERLTPMERKMLAAGWDWGDNAEIKLYGLMAVLGFVVLVGGTLLNMPPLLALFAAALAAYAPRWYLENRERNRAIAIEKDLPLALSRMAGLLGIQPDVAQVLTITANSISPGRETVLAEELRRTAAQMRSSGAEAGLRTLEQRSPSPSLAQLAVSLRIYADAGGEFSNVMSSAADRTREIIDGRNAAQAKAGEAAIAARALPLLLLGGTVFLAQDPQFAAFYRSTLGQVIIAVVIGMMIFGYITIQKMIEEVV
jgi:tight adherence protein B